MTAVFIILWTLVGAVACLMIGGIIAATVEHFQAGVPTVCVALDEQSETVTVGPRCAFEGHVFKHGLCRDCNKAVDDLLTSEGTQ
jgi:hypothetical protein